jgi:hypothetical protein
LQVKPNTRGERSCDAESVLWSRVSVKFSRIWRIASSGALLMCALVLPALAGTRHEQRVIPESGGWIQESTGPLDTDKLIEVTRFVGSVRVVSGAKSGRYTLRLHSQEQDERDARRQFSTFHLGIGRGRGEGILQTVGPVDMALRAELILDLPSKVETLLVDTLAGKITIVGKINQLDLRTHGGDIQIDDADMLRAVTMGGSVIVNHRLGNSFIRTDGGDIRVDASVGDLEIASLGGNIWLKAIAGGRVQSGGGNIEVVRSLGDLLVRTAGGNINLGEMGGAVSAESGGGSIRVGVAHGLVVASTAMGDIELWKLSQGAKAHTGMGRITAEFIADRSSMHDSELVTSMGDIVVFFGGSVPVNVRAVTGTSPTKRVISEFPGLKVSNGLMQYGPRSIMIEGTIHGGGPEIDLRTMVGQIELRNAH